jgi:hypothetical protein
MKKQLLALALLTAGMAGAQTWTQNFSSATPPGLPAGWMQNNVDALTTSTAISSYSFGTNAGVTRNITSSYGFPASFGNALITTSKYNPTGTSNDWVISPQFTVPANAVFNWQACSFDPSLMNSYEIRISTAGTLVTDFNANPALAAINNETAIVAVTDPWQSRGTSLNAYAGQSVYIAVHEISNNKWQLAMDNFSVVVPANSDDGSVLNVTGLTRYMVGAGTQTVNATFKQLGYATATTAVFGYKVNGGAPVTQTITFGSPVPYYGTAAFSFATPASLGLGTNKVKVWVESIDGNNEVNLANDTALQYVYVASVSKPRKGLIEEFSSSTCAPCAAVNTTNGFDNLIVANAANTSGSLSVVKYQMNWPSPGNDPSYNPDGLTRRTFYNCNSIPMAFMNGTTTMAGYSQSEINSTIVPPAYADITVSLTYSGTALVGSSTITPYVGIPSASPLKVFQVLAQKSYSFANPSTVQKEFHHGERKMFPDGNGTVMTPVDGTAMTYTFSHTATSASIYPPLAAQNSNNFWTSPVPIEYELIVFVQDMISKDIIQSGSAQAVNLGVGLVKIDNDASIGVYPNPAQDFAAVGIKLNNPSTVDITITDVQGKVVYSQKGQQVPAGQSEIKFNTADFSTGTYMISVVTNQGTMTEKLVISK